MFDLPPNIVGAVTARWRLVGTDGHVISSRVGFRVVTEQPSSTTVVGQNGGGEVAPGAGEAEQVLDMSATPDPVRLVLRLAGYLALVVIGGLLLADRYLVRGILGSERAVSTLVWGSVALAVVPLMQTLVFLDDSRGGGLLGSLLHVHRAFDTTPGSMTAVRFLSGAVLAVHALSIRRSHGVKSPPLISILLVLYVVSLAYTGHSRSMAWPILGVPTNVMHTVAVVVWLGGLSSLVFFVIPASSDGEAIDAYQRFGPLARLAVTTIVATGIVQTARLHGDVVSLFTEDHGRWLLLKLCLVATMLKIGDINRRRMARLAMAEGQARVHRSVLLRRASVTELVNGGLVIAVTAILVTASFD